MKEIPTASIDMILCDLPYGTTSCKWDTIIPFDLLWAHYNRIIKDNGAVVLFGSQPFTSSLIMSNPKMFRFAWVWDKQFAGNFALAKYQPQKIHEDIVVFSKEPCVFNPQKTKRDVPIKKGGNKTSKWESSKIAHAKDEYIGKTYEYKNPESIIHISSRSEKRGLHPTQKPVALCEYLINTYSNIGNVVLDNCMGSGSTGVAALNTNRHFFGIELDTTYCGQAKQRILDIDAKYA